MVASNQIRKIGEKKSRLHPTHLKWRVSIPHSSGRLPALGILPQQSRKTHAEARHKKARTKAHKYNYANEDKSTDETKTRNTRMNLANTCTT